MKPFQRHVAQWMWATFTATVINDRRERRQRFLEESLELVQAQGATEEEALKLVRYVFARPAGETWQEVGGVRVTLAALCNASGVDEDMAARRELKRCWDRQAEIQAKQAGRPRDVSATKGEG